MEKTYDPQKIEDAQYQFWLEGNFFRSEVDFNREYFSLVIPPPNVTGALHVGHALDETLQDIITRWQRMLGKNALWVPGTDHAGIATQMVVERELAKEGKTRQEIGRAEFERRAWQWKEYSHELIVQRLQKLGSSCDWSRERFTLDEGLSRAVRTAFVRLYKEGLIYKGEYIINWCPRCQTALSDLEVRHEQRDGLLYYIDYPVKGSNQKITVATTRPETMLGDTAVAVHPGDERYRDLVGKTAILPLLNREIPVIADDFVDREFGTGAVKVTPAHDPNDFLAGKRNNLPFILVIDGQAKMTAAAGPYAGLDRFDARKKVVEDLQAQSLLVKTEKHQYAIGQCDRCKTIVEPLLSTQWFLKMQPLAEPAIRAVEEGRTRFYPDNWAKVYFEWMRNIHDWCISRQLWWGHRIPAWYCDICNTITVEADAPEKCSCGGALRQETDVLDTWFSAGLWPFSVFGWPEQTPDLKYYYPTSLLVTGFDIIFFWVARMMMFGLKFMGEIPFRHVYIHGLVRDEHGQKMSKTRGNVVDPMEVIAEYGADSLRFCLAALSGPTPDIPLAVKRIQGYKAFLNKLWNSVRFALMKVNPSEDLTPLPESDWDLGDRWIASRLNRAAREVGEQLKEYRFDLASSAAYQFLWHEFCDWYIEWIKPQLNDNSKKKGLLLKRISEVLAMLHPFVPFVTEYLWQQLPENVRPAPAAVIANYPRGDKIDENAEKDFAIIIEVIQKIRELRTQMEIDVAFNLALEFQTKENREWILTYKQQIMTLAKMGQKNVDVNAEKDRLQRELKKIETDLAKVQNKLSNENFLRNAPEEVVAEQRARQEDLNSRKMQTEEHLRAL